MITLRGEGESRIEISKSVFIGHAIRVDSPEDADKFLKAERDLYPDARHSCYAWIIKGATNLQKYSDDGEPSGTAGLPMLSVLSKGEISNVIVVVTRYFGGVLLGKGGLVRAYTEATQEALRNAGICETSVGELFQFTLSYSLSEKVLFELRNKDFIIENIEYSDNVTITVLSEKEKAEMLATTVRDLTAGKTIPEKIGEKEINCGNIELF